MSWGAPSAPSGGVCPDDTAAPPRRAGSPRRAAPGMLGRAFGGFWARLRSDQSRLWERRQAAGLSASRAASLRWGSRAKSRKPDGAEQATPGLVITTLNAHSPKTTWRKDLYNYLSPVWNNRVNSHRTITSCTLHRQPGLLNRSKNRPGNDHHTDHVDEKILIGADWTHFLGNPKVKKQICQFSNLTYRTHLSRCSAVPSNNLHRKPWKQWGRSGSYAFLL